MQTDFSLSETERMVQQTARELFASFADNQHLRRTEASELGYDTERWEQFTALGWPALGIAEPLGSGGSPIDVGVLIEEVGRAAYPSPLLQVSSVVAVLDQLAAGAVTDALLGEIAGGTVAVLVAPLGESRLIAHREPGGYTVHGEHVIVEWGHVAERFVVLAPCGVGGWVLALVPDDHAGIQRREALAIDNERLGVLRLDGVEIRDEALLCDREIDAAAAAAALARVRLLRAAEMVGGASRALELTAAYMRERTQFGVPLGSFQAVQHMLADMLTNVDAARLTTYEGLSLAALGRPFEAPAAIAGFVAGRSYERVTVDAAQLHGGIGAATEHPLHHYYRRAKGMRLRLGTLASQLDRVVDAAVLGGSPGPWRRAAPATAEPRG